MKETFWLLPGFLGGDSHFGPMLELLDHWSVLPLTEFAEADSLESAARLLAQKAIASGERPHLVGYSMGGRLALQAALVAPGSFASVAALSSHPGINSVAERDSRQQEDQAWAHLLLTDWPRFWKEWNQRGVLAGTPIPERDAPSQSEAQQWARLLINLGTGQQNFLPPLLAEVPASILIGVGDQDKTYCQHLKLFPSNIKKIIIKGSGHRIPLEQPQVIVRELLAFAQENR